MQATDTNRRTATGLMMVVCSSLLFGIGPSFMRLVLSKGVAPMFIIACYAAIAATFNGLTSFGRTSLRTKPAALAQLALVGIVGSGVTSFLLSSAYLYIPVGFATITHFMYPVIVTVAMSLLFGQRFGVRQFAAMVCSISGMVFIIGLDFSGSCAGFALALCSSFTYSFYIIACNRINFGGLSTSARLFWMNLFSAAFFAIACLVSGTEMSLPDLGSTLTVLGCGSMMFLAHRLFMNGIVLVGPTPAAFTSMLEPITSLLFSSLVFHDGQITFQKLVGILLVLAAVMLVSLRRTIRRRRLS